MHPFAIVAHGEHFDPDAFAAAHSLPHTLVWRRGEPKVLSCIGSRHDTSGIAFEFREWTDATYLDQPRIARAFIAEHRDALRALGAASGVTTFALCLHYPIRLERNIVGFSLGAPTMLMHDLVDIGCSWTTYVTVEHSDSGPD